MALAALRDTVVFFQSPTEVTEEVPSPEQRLRIGGLVKPDSVVRDREGTIVFTVTDGASDVQVSFAGVLPDLFREGQGVVTEGHMIGPGQFVAEEVLAKHDETYMPPEVADALREQGVWQGE